MLTATRSPGPASVMGTVDGLTSSHEMATTNALAPDLPGHGDDKNDDNNQGNDD